MQICYYFLVINMLFIINILKQSLIIKTPLSRTGSEACESCSQYQRQLSELQKQLLLTKSEKDEALKLKEEVMDCEKFALINNNHQ